jgi:hypothetical protein
MTEIDPPVIDVSGYDLLVFGSPVWAFRPTPAIHTAITSLKGYEGKRAISFFTHGGRPGETGETFKKWIETAGMRPAGCVGVHQNDIENDKITGTLISRIETAKIPDRQEEAKAGKAPTMQAG